MTEAKHTPGPWVMRFEHPKPDYEYPYMRLSAGTSEDDYFDVSGIIQEPNARLIGAAPDMLAALTALLDCGIINPTGSEKYEAAIDATRAAVAKATGQ